MENIHQTFKLAVFFSWIVCGSCARVARRAGDQPPPGQCSTYKWGGTSGVHWYACCNNCDQTNPTCDGKTYQSASSTAYCARCGVDTKKGDGKESYAYACGGCSVQDSIQKKCSTKLRSIYKIPGFCWAFTKCFKRKCNKVASETSLNLKSVNVVPETCFNLRCDAGETVENCPTDCCGTVTEKCQWGNDQGTCRPECCQYSTCCNGTDGHFANLLNLVAIMFLVTLMI